RPPRGRRIALAVGWLALAALITAFWTLPLLARLAETRALAWGELSLASVQDTFVRHPFAAILAALSLAAFARLRQIPSRLPRLRDVLIGLAGVVLFALVSIRGETLTLWPRASQWPTYEATARGLRLPELWRTLETAPPGRVLFVRSGVPLVYGGDWWRPHTHVTALTPVGSGRDIVHGTFTHPSPIAALVYRGDAGRGAITQLAEQLDGRTLFGERLEALD